MSVLQLPKCYTNNCKATIVCLCSTFGRFKNIPHIAVKEVQLKSMKEKISKHTC